MCTVKQILQCRHSGSLMDISRSGFMALPSSAALWRAHIWSPLGCHSLCFALVSGAGPLSRGEREAPLILPGLEQTALSPRAWTGWAEGGPREQAASALHRRDHRAPASDGSCNFEKAWDTRTKLTTSNTAADHQASPGPHSVAMKVPGRASHKAGGKEGRPPPPMPPTSPCTRRRSAGLTRTVVQMDLSSDSTFSR